MPEHEKIDYLEFPAHDLAATKAFFESVFNWTFTDYGPDYTSFSKQGTDGGFYRTNLKSDSSRGAALAIFYSSDISSTLKKVEAAGGHISKPIFEFPGGRRFHFTEPSGNEFAVWSE